MGEGGILSFIRILLIFISLSFPSDAGTVAVDQPGHDGPTNAPVSQSDNVNSNLEESDSSMPVAVRSTPPPNGMIRTTLPFSMGHLGMIECEGAEKGADFLEQIFGNGVNFNRSDYLCGPTCRGNCVPRPRDVGIPPSIYPFGCSCESHGCNEEGPIITPLIKPTFKIACNQDPHCTCVGMGPGQYTGYSCNWINTESRLPVTFKQETPPTPSPSPRPNSTGRPPSLKLSFQFNSRFFPISWCSCCPRFPIVRND